MSRKYKSMEEELAARKAAGVYGDLSQYDERFFRNAPEWVKKSREEASRGKWSLREESPQVSKPQHRQTPDSGWTEAPSAGPGRQKESVRKQKTKVPRQKSHPRTGNNRPLKGKAGCLIVLALFFVVMPLAGAFVAVLGDILTDYDIPYDVEYADDWTEEDNDELNVNTSYSEAEEYILEMTESGDATDDELSELIYSSDIYALLNDNSSIMAIDGRVIIWAECSDKDDPGEVLTDQLHITEEIISVLDEYGYEDVSVGIIVKETEAWELRLLMIDQCIHYASGDFAELGE